jgi:hypothetical protein
MGNVVGRYLLPALAAVLLAALVAACGPWSTPTLAPTASASPGPSPATITPQHGWELPANEVVFIDHEVMVEGECVEGDCQPGPMIDFPTHGFDPDTRSVHSRLPLEVNDDLKVLYGDGTSLRGVAGGGAATRLIAVLAVPAEMEGVRIVQVDRDGTVTLEVGGEVLVLAPDEMWTNTTEEVREQGAGRARLITTEQIYNYGIVDKANILAPTPQP